MKYLIILILSQLCLKTIAQKDSTIPKNISPLTFSGYVEVYFNYDFNKPGNHFIPNFLYNHNRHNDFNINLAYMKASYNTENIRSNLSIAAGTYMNSNYAAEPSTLKNILEANAGVKIGKQNLWLDAGILPSHIGFESAISKDCWTLTRSILGENSPYFESGVKLTYITKDSKWLLSGLALNGWQRISRIEGNSKLSFGTQIQYKPNDLTTLNYSTFIGTDKPDSARLKRYFNNFYVLLNLNEKVGLTVGADLGFEQKSKNSSNYNKWYGLVTIVKYSMTNKLSLSARGEYYHDRNSVIIASDPADGFSASGYSMNIDYIPASNAVIRLEIKNLSSKNPIFQNEKSFTRNNSFITSSIAISF